MLLQHEFPDSKGKCENVTSVTMSGTWRRSRDCRMWKSYLQERNGNAISCGPAIKGGWACSLLAHVECREREGTKHKPVPGANLLCHRHFLQLAVWIQNQKNRSVVIQTWSWCGKPAASARAWLWKANAEGWHFIFPFQFAICSLYRNVEESEIQVCAWLREL